MLLFSSQSPTPSLSVTVTFYPGEGSRSKAYPGDTQEAGITFDRTPINCTAPYTHVFVSRVIYLSQYTY